jgi:hypothetical protein
MAMYCPQCSTTFEQRLQCPACGVRLLVQESRHSRGFAVLARGWQHTSWGRIFIGLMLAQGLFYGMRHLLTGVLLVVQGPNAMPEVLASLPGLISVQVMQVVSLLLGGLLAGAGRRGGFGQGLVLGLLNGLVAVLAQQWPATASHSLLPIYCQPLLQAFVGAFGGWLGGTIWKPLAIMLGPDGVAIHRKPLQLPKTPLFAGPIHWFRIAFGTVFTVGGCLSATYLLERAVVVSNDALAMDGYMQEKVVTWEMKALAMLLGSALAGICTTNGFKQGLIVGVLSGTSLAIAVAFRSAGFDVIALTMVSAVTLGLAGGTFGGQLFPPITRFMRPKGMGPASVR